MCLFVCAPGRQITVEYASEFIRLLPDGSSECTIDLLLADTSPAPTSDPVNKLYIIYPNSFYSVNDKISGVKQEGVFLDVTDTFLDRPSGWNWKYQNTGSDFYQDITRDNEVGIPLNVKIPYPPDPANRSIEYRGIISGKCSLSLYDFSNKIDWYLLKTKPTTVFKAELTSPLKHSEWRWFRWHFHASKSSINRYGLYDNFKRWFSNNKYFLYEIYGPYNVIDRLEATLDAMKSVVDIKVEEKNEPYKKTIEESINRLKKIIFGRIIKSPGTETLFKHWWLHIDPAQIGGRLTDVVHFDNIQVAGGMPNARQINGKMHLLYEWKAGYRRSHPLERRLSSDSPPKRPDNHFSLYFQAKPISKFILALPWIAGILSLVALFVALYK